MVGISSDNPTSAGAIDGSKDNSTTSPTADHAGAAFWELDSIAGGKFNRWLDSQIRIAVNDVALTGTSSTSTTSSNNATTSNSMSALDGAGEGSNQFNGTIHILHNNLLKALSMLKVVNAPKAVRTPTSNIDNDNGDTSHQQEDMNSDDDGSTDDDENYERQRQLGNGRGQKRRRPTNNKRRKEEKPEQTIRLLQDPYKVWFQVIDSDSTDANDANRINDGTNVDVVWNENQDDIPDTAGGKLAVLSIGGILNGIVAIQSSTDPSNPSKFLHPPGLCQVTLPNVKSLTKVVASNPYLTEFIKALGGQLTVQQLHAASIRLHRAVADQVKYDILQTTPARIQQMLASDLTQSEFAGVRKRVYDTVILGKGMGNAANDEEDAKDIPTASSSAQGIHDIEKFKKCSTCGNNDQAEFILDRKNGDVICSNCGTVVSESIMHEGSQFRKFEGEVDRNHHGDAANPLYSNAHNMSTSLSGVQPTSGAGIGGWGSGGGSGGGKRNLETILKNAHAYTELNVSQFGKTDRRTRVGYKDRQKKDAFLQMSHTGDALNLHEAVIQRAKELFAGFRDDRELIQQFKGVLAACLCEAFEQLSAEGKILLKRQTAQQEQQDQIRNKKSNHNGDQEDDDDDDDIANGSEAKHNVSVRAARRNELHHAMMAGKGGLSLNNSHQDKNGNGVNGVNAANGGGGGKEAVDVDDDQAEKSAASWDLEDCRTWLLETSRRIAQMWVEERNRDSDAARKLPTGPIEEIEGQLVEHSITLCEHLENEWRSRSCNINAALSSKSSMGNASSINKKKRVVTPRVTDMSKLGIKWQHAHERGSGGKGGVGNNARTLVPAPARKNDACGSGRTAGQILMLKTAQKFGVILKDPISGEAFHKELRNVIGRQEELKRKALRDEATRQRFHQMQRKPWLQARVQQQD